MYVYLFVCQCAPEAEHKYKLKENDLKAIPDILDRTHIKVHRQREYSNGTFLGYRYLV